MILMRKIIIISWGNNSHLQMRKQPTSEMSCKNTPCTNSIQHSVWRTQHQFRYSKYFCLSRNSKVHYTLYKRQTVDHILSQISLIVTLTYFAPLCDAIPSLFRRQQLPTFQYWISYKSVLTCVDDSTWCTTSYK